MTDPDSKQGDRRQIADVTADQTEYTCNQQYDCKDYTRTCTSCEVVKCKVGSKQ